MSDLSLEELLKHIEEVNKNEPRRTRKVGETKTPSSIEKFINEYGIESGLEKVPTFIIFHAYRTKWKGIATPNKANKIVFFRSFNKHFNQVRTGKQRYYLLNGSPFDLTREGLLEAKHYDEKQKKQRETFKKTRQRKKSELKEGS